MAMATSDMKRLIASVKAAIPDLEKIVEAKEEAEKALAEMGKLRTEISAFAVRRDTLRAELIDAEKQAEQAIQPAKCNQDKAQEAYNSRIADAQRKVNEMEAKVAAGAQKLEEQRVAHATAQDNHEQIVAQIEKKA